MKRLGWVFLVLGAIWLLAKHGPTTGPTGIVTRQDVTACAPGTVCEPQRFLRVRTENGEARFPVSLADYTHCRPKTAYPQCTHG